MRSFKIRKREKPIFISKAAFVNVTLMAGIAVFVGLATMTGRLVSQGILPGDTVVVAPGPTASADSGANTEVEYKTIRVEAEDHYFVQFGVFANEENARTCAESIIAKGGAGYIKSIEGKHFVFAMGYSVGDDAKTVVSQLKAQGYSTLMKCYSHDGLELNVKGSDESIERLTAAYNGANGIDDELERIIFEYDKKEYDANTLKQKLTALMDKIEVYGDCFGAYGDQNKIFEDAKVYCEGICADISEIIAHDDEAELASLLKFVYINGIFNWIEYLDNAVIA